MATRTIIKRVAPIDFPLLGHWHTTLDAQDDLLQLTESQLGVENTLHGLVILKL